MTQYFIKDGYGEKGPYSLDELKKLKIAKTTFVRTIDNDKWIQADSVQGLDSTFKLDFRFFKVTFLFFLVLGIIGSIILMLPKMHFNSSSSSSSNSQPPEISEIPTPPIPPSIDYKVSKHEKKIIADFFKDCNLSGEKKQLVNACNYTNEIVRNTAVSLAGESAGTFNFGQICNIFDYCYDNWKYVNDSKINQVVEFASSTINNGLNGDCDDFAVLVCSMVISIGGEARINYAYGKEGGHAFTEVNIGKENKEEIENYISQRYSAVYNNDGIGTRTDNSGNMWLNLDWFAKHPGGGYFDYTKGTTFYILQKYCDDF